MKISELGTNWPIAYEKCLYAFKMKEAAAIAKYYKPTKVYKYYSFDSQYWKQNIFDFEIAFNVPSEFNDPLDSRWFLNYKEILKARFEDAGEEWSEEKYHIVSEQLYEEDLMYLREMFFVSCFSTTPYSNPMWGHYSNKHTGFCLEYDVALLPKEMQLLLPVVYVEKPYDASRILDMRGIEDKYARLCPSLFKSKDWAYENEWRAFIPTKDSYETLVIPAVGSITGIYFGFNSYKFAKQIKTIEDWARQKNIPMHQIERTYLSFELTSDNIDDIRSPKPIKGLLI